MVVILVTIAMSMPGGRDVTPVEPGDVDGNESTDSITISVIASVGNLTISEIQGEQDSSPYENQYVTTSGYVMAKNSNGFFMQDAAAAWSGIWVVDFGNANTSVGDEIEVSAHLKLLLAAFPKVIS